LAREVLATGLGRHGEKTSRDTKLGREGAEGRRISGLITRPLPAQARTVAALNHPNTSRCMPLKIGRHILVMERSRPAAQ
jgi:hypothetical protein